MRFENENIREVLADWYQQAVFSSLTTNQRQSQIDKRATNNGNNVAKMLRSTSLASQPELLLPLKQLNYPIHYIVGEKDHKFLALAEQSQLSVSVIDGAGHNAHSEQPQLFARVIIQLINQ